MWHPWQAPSHSILHSMDSCLMVTEDVWTSTLIFLTPRSIYPVYEWTLHGQMDTLFTTIHWAALVTEPLADRYMHRVAASNDS